MVKQFMHTYQNRIQQALTQLLPRLNSQPQELNEAIHYMVLGGGKRIRPLLVYASGLAFAAELPDLDKIAASVELIHIYSLIHDDLPAMDNDDLRHGKLSCHKKYNDAIAILCGDALQSLAFEILSNGQYFKSITPERQIIIINTLAHAIGAKGMVAGQILDIAAEGKKIELSELETIHRLKTGALITSSILMGALAASTTTINQLEHLKIFSENLGLVFQIHDDIIDIESSTEKLGKKHGADIAKNKATYPAIIGLVEAKRLEKEYFNNAIAALEQVAIDGHILKAIANFIIERDY